MKVLYNDGHIDECPADEVTHVVRHSAAHIMAQAVKRLYPEADFAYGPATDNGFYYDIDLPEGQKISEEDFPAIEAEMKKIVKENLKFTVFELPREEAIALMEERGEKYKVEHIGDLDPDARITFYQQGEYIDMCVGPHLTYTKALKAFKLTGVSGAYWIGRATRTTRCLPASTAPPLPRRRSSTSTCACSRRPRSATTARSAARWTSS